VSDNAKGIPRVACCASDILFSLDIPLNYSMLNGTLYFRIGIILNLRMKNCPNYSLFYVDIKIKF